MAECSARRHRRGGAIRWAIVALLPPPTRRDGHARPASGHEARPTRRERSNQRSSLEVLRSRAQHPRMLYRRTGEQGPRREALYQLSRTNRTRCAWLMDRGVNRHYPAGNGNNSSRDDETTARFTSGS